MGEHKGFASRIRFASGVDAVKSQRSQNEHAKQSGRAGSPQSGDIDIVKAAERLGFVWSELPVPQRRKLRELALTMMPANTVRKLVRSAG